MDQLATYELCVLAKEKGFNLDCDCAYNANGKLIAAQYYDISPNNERLDEWLSGGNVEYATPTQNALAKWLREVHKIQISIPWYGYYEYHLKVEPGKIVNKSDKYDSWELALENGLLEGLKLINNERSTS